MLCIEERSSSKLARIIVINQEQLETINVMNNMKIDNLYTVLNENEEYSTIVQYSKKYDNMHIATVKTDNLDKSKSVVAGE